MAIGDSCDLRRVHLPERRYMQGRTEDLGGWAWQRGNWGWLNKPIVQAGILKAERWHLCMAFSAVIIILMILARSLLPDRDQIGGG